MAMDYFTLGPAPACEECVQLSSKVDYLELMRKECEKYQKMLEKRFPSTHKNGCWFRVKTFQHDFGPYMEVAICYKGDNTQACSYAIFVENNVPELWAEEKVFTDKDYEKWQKSETLMEATDGDN